MQKVGSQMPEVRKGSDSGMGYFKGGAVLKWEHFIAADNSSVKLLLRVFRWKGMA